MGERRYGAVGIAREDKEGRARIRARNWGCFGARTALFCYLGEGMLPPQWMDAGIVLQSVMLLLRVEGLDSCPQIAWAEYHRTVAQVIEPPNGHVLACGMSIGYADPQQPQPPMPCAPLPEVSHSSTSEPIAVTEFRFPLRYVADVQVRRRPENRLADQPGDSPATRRARLSRDFCRWLPLPASPCWQATSPPLTYVDAAGPAATADHAVWFALRYWTAWQRGSVRRS
jgi:hypothetical protein